MRVSTVTTLAVALLASDAAAWRHRGNSWRWSRPGRGGSVIDPVTCTDAVEAPAPTADAPVVPAPAPTTTLVEVTTTPEAAPPAADTEAPAAPPATGNLGDDEQKALDAHNAARSEVGTPALEWDDELAQAALEWANHLTSVGSLTHSSGTGHGENLYMQSGRSAATPLTDGSDAWISEKSDYSGQPVGQGNFGSYGHYSMFPFLFLYDE